MIMVSTLPYYVVLSVFATKVASLAVNRNPSLDMLTVRQCLDESFASASQFLSPTSIVEMIPKSASAASSTTSSSANRAASIKNTKPLRQELFASPLISVLYERVLPPLWSAGLRIGGPDEEYQNAASWLLDNGEGDGTCTGAVALDLSCGTGFVAIRMAKSGKFRHVFALDYSRQMLNEAVATVKREAKSDNRGVHLPLSIIRGDAGRLPFKDGTIDAVHWGAAMHCVPDAEGVTRECYRVLKPGGRIYATTFLRPFPDIVFRFFDLNELETISEDAGFGADGGKLEVEALGRVYGVIRAEKGQ